MRVLAIVAVLGFMAAPVLADITAWGGAEPQGGGQGATQSVIWNNWGAHGAATASQLDVVYPFDAQVADDFMFEEETTILDVHWIGGFWSITGDPLPQVFNIFFYTEGEEECPYCPGLYKPTGGPEDPSGTAIASILNFQPDSVTALGADYYEYYHDIPAVTLGPGHYWMAIQWVGPFTGGAQWGWSKNLDLQLLCCAVQGFPLLAMPYWTTIEPCTDMVWQLTPEPTTLLLLGFGGLALIRRR